MSFRHSLELARGGEAAGGRAIAISSVRTGDVPGTHRFFSTVAPNRFASSTSRAIAAPSPVALSWPADQPSAGVESSPWPT